MLAKGYLGFRLFPFLLTQSIWMESSNPIGCNLIISNVRMCAQTIQFRRLITTFEWAVYPWARHSFRYYYLHIDCKAVGMRLATPFPFYLRWLQRDGLRALVCYSCWIIPVSTFRIQPSFAFTLSPNVCLLYFFIKFNPFHVSARTSIVLVLDDEWDKTDIWSQERNEPSKGDHVIKC